MQSLDIFVDKVIMISINARLRSGTAGSKHTEYQVSSTLKLSTGKPINQLSLPRITGGSFRCYFFGEFGEEG